MLLFHFLFRSGKPFQFFVKIGLISLVAGVVILTTLVFSPPTISSLVFWSVIGMLSIQMAIWMVLFGLIVELILRTHYLAQQETQYEIIVFKAFNQPPRFKFSRASIHRKDPQSAYRIGSSVN